jgi:two-component system response regulator HydG
LHVLVVDEDAAVRSACCEIAAGRGFASHGVATFEAARNLLRGNSVDVLLIDIKAGGGAGQELLEQIKVLQPEMAVIVMTAFATVTSAVEAMRTGATHYLTKPFTLEDLAGILQRAVERRTVDVASRLLRDRLRTQQGLGNIIGSSPEMEKLYRILSKVAHPRIRCSYWARAELARNSWPVPSMPTDTTRPNPFFPWTAARWCPP